MATRSMPIVPCTSMAWAMADLVPTPSVEEASTGSRYRCSGNRNSEANPPMPPITSGRWVFWV